MTDRKGSVSLGISLGIHPLVGIAVLPLLKILEEQNAIALTKIMGSGQGALSAALLASKKPEKEIRKALKIFYKESHYNKFNKNMATTMFNVGPQSYHPSQSFFSGSDKSDYFEELFGNERIEKLAIPLSLVATDLFTAEPVILTTGKLSQAVYGASAWFPFHPPARFQGRLLVSGGFSDSIPTINDSNLDLEISISIQDKVSWQKTEHASDGWAFFERAFQTLEIDKKTKIRKSEGTNIIPLPIIIDEPIPFNGITEKHLDYVYKISNDLLHKIICSS